MKGFTNEWLAKHNAKDSGGGARPGLQERKDDDKGAADNPSRKAKMDGASGPYYRITITLRTSDERDRDGDGMVSTLLDTYLFALGRLLGLDRTALRKLAKSEQRRRGGRHPH
jgi:hypothetical protein